MVRYPLEIRGIYNLLSQNSNQKLKHFEVDSFHECLLDTVRVMLNPLHFSIINYS